MAVENQKERAKFVVRFDDVTKRDQVDEAATKEHISMNAFILQAIDEKLSRGRRMDALMDRAEKEINQWVKK
uniref:Arc-like DNA binding domain-containing protein n=1 Tax=Pseudomonas phage Orisa03 TaxID=3138542 RepID=A0AAU6W3M8_9VIRU